jgi:hypothetical protein
VTANERLHIARPGKHRPWFTSAAGVNTQRDELEHVAFLHTPGSPRGDAGDANCALTGYERPSNRRVELTAQRLAAYDRRPPPEPRV